MNKPIMFEAYARRNDPETSKSAANSVKHDVARLEMIVFLAVRAAGERGLTWDEAEPATGLNKASISPRWKPLKNKGLIKEKTVNGEIVKRNGSSGRGQIVWVAA